MDHLQRRLEVLEQQTHTVARQLRWWQGLAYGLIGIALLTWALPSVTAQDAEKKKSLEQRVAALEDLLKHFTRMGNEVAITGVNLRIVNGLGTTGTINGLGNLIVGYNELRQPKPGLPPDNRTGSHNMVVGIHHNFSSFGGLVAGATNEISGEYASVSGGLGNTASEQYASVSGGESNTASKNGSSVCGGFNNIASGTVSTVSGGSFNTASGPDSSVSGGNSNTASGDTSLVSGGKNNTASGFLSSVSGGLNRTVPEQFNWGAGSLFEDE